MTRLRRWLPPLTLSAAVGVLAAAGVYQAAPPAGTARWAPAVTARVVDCRSGWSGAVSVTYEVTNPTGRPITYLATVVVADASGTAVARDDDAVTVPAASTARSDVLTYPALWGRVDGPTCSIEVNNR